MKIVLLGAPGTGKGTQAQFISNQYNLPIISTGNILRKLVKKNTKVGNIINNSISNGKLVPDIIITTIVKNIIAKLKKETGFILDGFPRTIQQANELKKMGININYVFEFILSKDIILKRLQGRRVDPITETIYNINIDSNNNTKDLPKKLTIRTDDHINIINKRFQEYETTTKKLSNFFIEENKKHYLKYFKIDSNHQIEFINKKIKKILKCNKINI